MYSTSLVGNRFLSTLYILRYIPLEKFLASVSFLSYMMVSTRHHPRDFPPPPTPASASTSTPDNTAVKPSPTATTSPTTSGTSRKWVHTPSAAVTIWLVMSVPLVLWDAGYVLLRPHSMPGGKWHSPIWTPYALYGTIDYIYGWPAFNARNGFTAAQTVLNLLETACYVFYLAVIYRYGATVMPTSGRAAQKVKVRKGLSWFLLDEKVVAGRIGAVALLVAFSGSVATFSKTVLYCKYAPVSRAILRSSQRESAR